MNILIFSKDRPAQLDALFVSMQQFLPSAALKDVLCIYAEQNVRVAQKMRRRWGRDLKLFQETSTHTFSRLFDMIVGSLNPISHTLVLCDDEVFYRPCTDICELQITNDQVYSHALRLGSNITECYTNFGLNNLNECNPQAYGNGQWLWKWAEGCRDFAYPWSITGHVWNTKWFREVLAARKQHFTSPNTLEGVLMQSSVDHNAKPYMTCPHLSLCVNVPLNKVQRDNNNHAGIHYFLSIEDAKQRFLDNQRLQYKIDPEAVTAAHQEFDYEWVSLS